MKNTLDFPEIFEKSETSF